MGSIYARIGQQIRKERKKQSLSIDELAEKVLIGPSFLGQIERGQRKLSVATLEKVALALNVNSDDLMKDSIPKRNLTW